MIVLIRMRCKPAGPKVCKHIYTMVGRGLTKKDMGGLEQDHVYHLFARCTMRRDWCLNTGVINGEDPGITTRPSGASNEILLTQH